MDPWNRETSTPIAFVPACAGPAPARRATAHRAAISTVRFMAFSFDIAPLTPACRRRSGRHESPGRAPPGAEILRGVCVETTGAGTGEPMNTADGEASGPVRGFRPQGVDLWLRPGVHRCG